MRDDPDFQAYRDQWFRQYDALNYGTNLSSRILLSTHRLIEKPFSPSDHFGRVLEVGAGTAIHLKFVRHRFDEYVITDLAGETIDRAMANEWHDGKVRAERQDAARLTYPDHSFDRLIATHVLEHLYRPHEVLHEWNRVVRPGGVLSLILPCDPGLLWRVGRQFGPRRRARSAGLDYDYWMAREHVNPIQNLVCFIKYYFDDITEEWWPMRLPLPDLNLIYAVTIRKS